MGVFNTKATLKANPSLIPAMADNICQVFEDDGYDINRDELVGGGIDISVAKGGFFKAIFGLKTALKITLMPRENGISFEAGIGIFGQQVVPTAILLLTLSWPILVAQIWGMVQQSKLDEKALEAANAVIAEQRGGYAPGFTDNTGFTSTATGNTFCTNCGAKVPAGTRFCPNCGSPLN